MLILNLKFPISACKHSLHYGQVDSISNYGIKEIIHKLYLLITNTPSPPYSSNSIRTFGEGNIEITQIKKREITIKLSLPRHQSG